MFKKSSLTVHSLEIGVLDKKSDASFVEVKEWDFVLTY